MTRPDRERARLARLVRIHRRGGNHSPPSLSVEQRLDLLRAKLTVILSDFKLTDAELAVTIQRLLGKSVKEVATLRHSKQSTVKSHSRRVHAATDVRDHAKLAALVLLLVSEFDAYSEEDLDHR